MARLIPPTLAPFAALTFAATLLAVPGVARADAGEDVPSFAAQADVPRGTYVRVPFVGDVAAAIRPQASGDAKVIYLNRCVGGLTLTSGWPDDNIVNRSGILNGTTTLPEFSYGDEAWAQVMEETSELFAPFNVVITDVDPAPDPHDEAVVCGSGQDAGWGGAGGVAPFSCGVIDAPITFTFPESLGGHPRTIAEVIGQEVAHAWGLEHEFKCEDPMSYLNGCGEKTFQDGDFPCGEFSASSCECGGATQNSFQHILGLFGPSTPDAGPPSAAITFPADGAVFETGASFDVTVNVTDDATVTRVQLFANDVADQEDTSDPWGPWEITNIQDGAYSFYIVAEDAAGNSTVSDTVSITVTSEEIPPDTGESESGPDSGMGDSDGASDSGDSDDSNGSGGDDDDADEDDSDGESFETDDASLPPGFGGELPEAGCACATSTKPSGWGFALLLLPILVRLRRR